MTIDNNLNTFRKGFFLSVLSLALFISCDDNSSGPDDLTKAIGTGSFSAEVSGDLSLEFSGVALFATQIIDGPTGNIFVLSLNTISSPPNYVTGVTILNSRRLDPGTYTIDEEASESSGFFTMIPSQDQVISFQVTGGEMTVSSSSSENFQGELMLQATQPDNGDEVTILAEFNASCQQSEFTSCD